MIRCRAKSSYGCERIKVSGPRVHFKGLVQINVALLGRLKGTWRTTDRVSVLVTFVSFRLAKCPACQHSAHCQLSQPVKSSGPFCPLSTFSLAMRWSGTRFTMKAPPRWQRAVSAWARESVAFNDSRPASDVVFSCVQSIASCAATCVDRTAVFCCLSWEWPIELQLIRVQKSKVSTRHYTLAASYKTYCPLSMLQFPLIGFLLLVTFQ